MKIKLLVSRILLLAASSAICACGSSSLPSPLAPADAQVESHPQVISVNPSRAVTDAERATIRQLSEQEYEIVFFDVDEHVLELEGDDVDRVPVSQFYSNFSATPALLQFGVGEQDRVLPVVAQSAAWDPETHSLRMRVETDSVVSAQGFALGTELQQVALVTSRNFDNLSNYREQDVQVSGTLPSGSRVEVTVSSGSTFLFGASNNLLVLEETGSNERAAYQVFANDRSLSVTTASKVNDSTRPPVTFRFNRVKLFARKGDTLHFDVTGLPSNGSLEINSSLFEGYSYNDNLKLVPGRNTVRVKS